jgi:hypothetical protein
MQQPPSLDAAKARFRATSQAITPLALLKKTVRRYPGVSIGMALTAGALSVRTLPRVYQSLQKHSWLAILISRWMLRIN